MKPLFTNFFCCIVFIFSSATTFAHFGDIKGNIKDNITNLPVTEAKITLGETILNTVTDSLGNFSFAQVPAQHYIISIEAKNYQTKSFDFIVEADKVSTLNFYLTPSLISLPDVVVKSDRPVTSSSSMLLNRVDFELRPKNSAQDMLRLVPGLFIAQHAGGGKAEQIFVRGFDCDHGTDVATFVDGIPVNMPSHGHGQGYADLHFLIPETVNRMEIYKGPYFTQFGDFATGAAVQFRTLDSLEHNTLQFDLGSVPGHANITGRRGLLMAQIPSGLKNTSSYFAGDILYTPGYFDNSQHFNRYTIFNKTTYRIAPQSSLSLSIGSFGSSWDANGQIPERAVNAGLISRFGSIDTTEGGTTSRSNINLQFRSGNEKHKLESQIYYCAYRFKLFSNFTFFLNDPIKGDEIEQDDNRSILGYNGSYSVANKFLGINAKTIFGLGFRSDNIENSLWHAASRVRLSAKAHALVHERSNSFYINEQIPFTSWFRAEVGLRSDYFVFDVEDLLPTDSIHTNYSGFSYQTQLSPKINLIFSPSDNLKFFINSGYGYHSNDARSVVQQATTHHLPKASGAEFGTLIRINNRVIISAALWGMELENELVYVGDNGTTEDRGPSRRTGIDFSTRVQFTQWLFADVDVNYAHNVFITKPYGEVLQKDNLIPLAPVLTSTGGITARHKSGLEASLRYRYMADRPANESYTVTAHGYNIFDFTGDYHNRHYKIGFTIENLLNTQWNEAQFDTESRLFNESAPVEELNFTAGTPIASKLSLGIFF